MRLFQFPGSYVFLLSFSVYPISIVLDYALYNFVMSKTMIGLTDNIPKWSLLFTALNLGILIYAALPALIGIASFFYWWLSRGGDSPWWDKTLGVLSIVGFVIVLIVTALRSVRPIIRF